MAFLQDALTTMGDALSGSSTVKSTTTTTQQPLIGTSSKAPLIIGLASGAVALLVIVMAFKMKKTA